MHFIIYISDYIGTDLNKDLRDISEVAKRDNPDRGITGLLFYHNGNFLQAIEGERENLEELLTVLEKDERHENITRVVDTEVKERSFSDWHMDSFNLDANKKLKREDVIEFSKHFSTQCEIQSSTYIKCLKKLCLNPDLRSIDKG